MFDGKEFLSWRPVFVSGWQNITSTHWESLLVFISLVKVLLLIQFSRYTLKVVSNGNRACPRCLFFYVGCLVLSKNHWAQCHFGGFGGRNIMFILTVLISVQCFIYGLPVSDQLSRLHMILKPFMLRRIKKDVENELSDKVRNKILFLMSLSLRVLRRKFPWYIFSWKIINLIEIFEFEWYRGPKQGK